MKKNLIHYGHCLKVTQIFSPEALEQGQYHICISKFDAGF